MICFIEIWFNIEIWFKEYFYNFLGLKTFCCYQFDLWQRLKNKTEVLMKFEWIKARPEIGWKWNFSADFWSGKEGLFGCQTIKFIVK